MRPQLFVNTYSNGFIKRYKIIRVSDEDEVGEVIARNSRDALMRYIEIDLEREYENEKDKYKAILTR